MRTPHNRALVPVAAASSVPGQGGGFWTGRSGGGGALRRRCGATREQGLQAPAVGLGRGGEIRCRRSRAVRTPHSRALVPVAAASGVPGQGGLDRTVWRRRRAAAALRRYTQASASAGCGAGAGQSGELKGAAEPCTHRTNEHWCRSRLRAACQAKAAGFGPGVWRRRRAAALRHYPRAGSAGAGCEARAVRRDEMQARAEQCAHLTNELCYWSQLCAACQARAASIGPSGLAAAGSCGPAALHAAMSRRRLWGWGRAAR